MIEQPIAPLAPFAMTADYLYFLSGESTPAGPTRLLRADRLGLTQVLAETLPQFTGLGVAAGRIYLWGGGENLWSGRDPRNLDDEGFAVDSLAEHAGVVYADRQGTIISRTGDAPWTPRPWIAGAVRAERSWLVANSLTLAVLRMYDEDSPSSYRLFLVEPTAVSGANEAVFEVESGPGTPLRLRTTGNHVYWLVENVDGTRQLRRVDMVTRKIQHLATGPGLSDFAIDGEFVYLAHTLYDDSRYEIEAIPILNISAELRLGTNLDMLFPEAFGEQLWFFADERLLRVDLQIGEF